MKKIAQHLMLVGLVAGFLAGCNTMAGVGTDMETLGKKIEKKADQK